MKGQIKVKFLLIVSLIVIGITTGAVIFRQVTIDEKVKVYRTSTHAVGLDLSSFVALTGAATGEILINYETYQKTPYVVNIENRILEVKNPAEESGNAAFKFSIPFDFTKLDEKMKTSGNKFTASNMPNRLVGVT